jgi:tetratricopeptide (TPR) repeat protein
VRLDANSPVAHYNRGRVLSDLGRRDDARQELEIANRLAPNYASALFLLSVIEDGSPRALELLEKVLALNPRDAQAQYLLGKHLERLGKTQEAIHHWKLAVEVDPNNYAAFYNLARALSKSHAPESTKYMDRFIALQKALQLTDQAKELNNFALDAASNHDWPLAINQLKEALEVCGPCSERAVLHRNLGLIYARKGDINDGERELQLALEISPRDADALKAIKILQDLQERRSNSN